MTTRLEALKRCQNKTKIAFLAFWKFKQKVPVQKRISKKKIEYAHMFYELTISSYFIALVRNNGIWRLTLAHSAVGTGCGL